jgi:hypothetical protein
LKFFLREGGERLQGYYWTLKSVCEELCYILWIEPTDCCISGFWLWGVVADAVKGAKEKLQARTKELMIDN